VPTIVLLTISNVFMTIAWYGHLKFKGVPLWQAILVSWLIAFFEYCFQVPANRLGHAGVEEESGVAGRPQAAGDPSSTAIALEAGRPGDGGLAGARVVRPHRGQFTAAQLKTIQEVITLVVFCVFSVLYLKEPIKWNYLAGFAMMVGAVFFVFKKW